MRTVEMVIGYDADGRPHNIVLVDGHETDVTVYELYPDAKLLQRGRAGNWILQQERCAAQATPEAAARIRSWAYQTVHDGHITPDSENDDVPDPDAVIQVGDTTVRRFRGPDGTSVVDERGDMHGGLTF